MEKEQKDNANAVILDKDFFLTPGRLDAFACALLKTKDIDEALKASSSDEFVPASVYLDSKDADKVRRALNKGFGAQGIVYDRSKTKGDLESVRFMHESIDVLDRSHTFSGYLSEEAREKAWRKHMDKECAENGCE